MNYAWKYLYFEVDIINTCNDILKCDGKINNAKIEYIFIITMSLYSISFGLVQIVINSY